ncbi:MAG: IS1 family transposase [Geminicoccaceae bacterium]
MNRLPLEKRVQIIGLLVEGMSLRAASRLSGCSINTVTKLLIDVGKACQTYHDEHVRNLSTRRVQVDEIWSFVYSKQKNVAAAKRKDLAYGDVWTWTAIDADNKLAISWLVGSRDADYANAFLQDVADRLSNRVQLTSDGHGAYLDAVERAFGSDIDFATLIKLYGTPPEGQRRYSPPVCVGARKEKWRGKPDPEHISTSYVERQNLTMRMHMRRFTRLTNAFSKKIENHAHAVALHFMFYNFVRIHKTLKVSPAMAAAITDHLWELEDIVKLLD